MNNNKTTLNSNELLWQEVQWKLVEHRISRLQNRIYKYSLNGEKRKVDFLQRVMISSLDAKLLAVRKVTTENKGKKTAGLDGNLYLTPEEKINLVTKIDIDGKTAPIGRIWISKPGKTEKKPIGIPIIKDRVKQKLVLMALEPEWEAKFEHNSYGFRPGYSVWDATEAIFLSLRNHKGDKETSKYILHADLKGCFDNINHSYLLKKLESSPKITAQVNAWLKAGIFEGLTLDPPYVGIENNEVKTPQGGIISPFLANVALHGMENHLKQWICDQKWPMENRHESYTANKMKSLTIIRYADDFVIIHKDYYIVQKAKDALSQWLTNTSQLKFNEEKTKIVNSNQGFNFLGFSFINIKRNNITRLKIYPSTKNQKKLITDIGDFCRKHRSMSTFDFVKSLRPKILGWGNYFKYCECQDTFSKMDRLIFNSIRAWVFRRDRRNNRTTIKEKYFPSGKTYTFDKRQYKDNWILVGKQKEAGGNGAENFLPKLSWITSTKFVKIKSGTSIYDGNETYWSLRTHKYGNFNLRERTLLKNQNGLCTYCNSKILDHTVEIDHILAKALGGKDTYKNWQLLHKHCHVLKTQQDRKKIANNKSRAG